jgi:hypothetical protein
MRYIDLKNHFDKEKKYKLHITICCSHIKDFNNIIEPNKDFFILWNCFSVNNDLEFYIELNNFFNNHKPCNYEEDEKVIVKILLSIAACTIPLSNSFSSIDNSFFIIHSAIDYGVELNGSIVKHNNFQSKIILLLVLVMKRELSNEMSSYLFSFLTYVVIYAKEYSTDFCLVNDLIYNINKIPGLLESISKEKNIDFLMHLLDWCYDNKHSDIEIFYNILNNIGIKTNDDTVKYNIELCLYRYREIYEKDYDCNSLVVFYEKNVEQFDLINKLRVLTGLFIKVNRDKYLNIYSEEIAKLDNNTLIKLIEDVAPKTFSAYLTHLAVHRKEVYFNFLHTTYGCSKEILEDTAFYIHSDDATYILEKTLKKFDTLDPDLHFNMIQYLNEIYGLGITVFGESANQKIPEDNKPHRENVPNDSLTILEEKLIESIEKYYFVDQIVLNENTKFILSFQQIKFPLQQILLKKYNKLYPLVKIHNKVDISEKKLENVIHITLSESMTLDQEKEAMEYLKFLTDEINFEYRYIDNVEELLEVLRSDKYSVISITSHGEVDIREPSNNKIKIGEKYISVADFETETYTINNKRLLYLNICDSGHFKFKNGFMLDSLSTYLTSSNQATISNILPINQFYSSTFLMIFLHHLITVNSFKEAYKLTLILAIEDKLDFYINKNNLTSIELFQRYQTASINKKSIVNWGALLYQE